MYDRSNLEVKFKDAFFLVQPKASSPEFPFRFLAAYKGLICVTYVHTTTMLSALEKAVRESVNNLEGFGSETSVFVTADVSGVIFTDIQMWSSTY